MPRTRKVPLTIDQYEVFERALRIIEYDVAQARAWYADTLALNEVHKLVEAARSLRALRGGLYRAVVRTVPEDLRGDVLSERLKDADPRRWGPGSMAGAEVPAVATRLAQWSGQLVLMADLLFLAYPVALGDRALHCAQWLAYEAQELPYRQRRAQAS